VFTTAESIEQLDVVFKEGDAMTVENIGEEGTTTSEGWHLQTKWEPARVRYTCIGSEVSLHYIYASCR